MTSFGFRVTGLSLSLVLALGGCMEGIGAGVTGATRSSQATERDIEAPNVFSKRDRALWDGRPSLGGVWVAHPDVRAPERVIIRNTENGRETIGALFKRERMNPGPVFQVSADAASAVGMLPGAPTAIEVVALRTEEITPASTAPEPAAPAPETLVAAAASAPAPEAASAPAAAPAPVQSVASAAPIAPQTAATETMIAMPEQEAPRQGLLSRLFGRGAATETPAIETQALADLPAALPANAAAALPEGPLRMPTPLTTAAPASAAPAASVAAAAAASTLAQPFIQLGIFSVEANANRARSMAANAGLSARVVAGQSQGNQFWRVTVGPATDATDQRAMLAKVKSLGFNDAYTVRR
jgi:rare lipoprotein A